MRFWKQTVLFYAGGTIYMTLEFLWRGWSHGSMFLLGGLCFLIFGRLGRLRLPLAVKTLLGAGVVTSLELLTGLAVNRDYQVWDYRHMAGNFRGQICPVFSLLWVPISFAGILLYGSLSRRIDRRLAG